MDEVCDTAAEGLRVAKLRAERTYLLAEAACAEAKRAFALASVAVIDAELRGAREGPLPIISATQGPAEGSSPERADLPAEFQSAWKNPAGRLSPEGEKAAFLAFERNMSLASISRLFRITPKAAASVRERWHRFTGTPSASV